MERRGSGFKKICQDYILQSNYREELHPRFYSDKYDFVLTLYDLNYEIGNEETDIVPQSSPKFPNLARAVINFLESASEISWSNDKILG